MNRRQQKKATNKAPCKEEANLAWGRSVKFGPMLLKAL